MKKFLLTGVILCLFAVSLQSAALNNREYKFSAKVSGPFVSDSIYRLHAGEGILKEAARGCADVRLVDDRGNEVPYAVIDHRETTPGKRFYTLHIIAYSEERDGDRLTVRVPRKAGQLSKLKLQTTEKGFVKKYLLEGSMDRRTWKRISGGLVYDFYPTVHLRKTDIAARQSSFRYLRINLKSTDRSSREAEKILLRFKKGSIEFNRRQSRHLKIDSIRGVVWRGEKISARYDGMALKHESGKDDSEGSSVFSAPSGVPAVKAVLTVNNRYFFREVEVEGSDTGKADSWRFVSRASIHRFDLSGKKDEEVSLELPGRKFSFIRFKIRDGSNPTLLLKKIELFWPRQYLFFIPSSPSKEISIWWGSLSASLPEYDISHFINQASWYEQRFHDVKVVNIERNLNYDPAIAGGGYMRYALFVLVFFLMIGMGFWIYRLGRHVKI